MTNRSPATWCSRHSRLSNVGTSVNACLGTGTGSPRLFGGARLYSRTRLATRVQLQPTPVQRGPAQCSPESSFVVTLTGSTMRRLPNASASWFPIA